MKYVLYLNERMREVFKKHSATVIFGQNVCAGSCLSGLTKGLGDLPKQLVMNTPNIENTQVGAGFGLMLNGVSSVFYMKQQDFLLLGIDQLVNSGNFLRQNKMLASFTIVTIVVDKGYEGIQSSLNNCGDFCSIARILGYTISNRHDADYVISKHLVSPGFRIIAVSQRLFNTEIISCGPGVLNSASAGVFKYYQGSSATIVCFNFSFPQGIKLRNELKSQNVDASLFSVSASIPVSWKPIIEDVVRTGNLIILDDSKCVNRCCYQLSYAAQIKARPKRIIMLVRDVRDSQLRPHSDIFTVDSQTVIKAFKRGKNF